MSEARELRAAIAANQAFYEAFAAGDYDRMEALWATTSPAICIHPGTPPIHGRPAVMESWRSLLEEPREIGHGQAQVAVIRGVAFVTCLEEIATTTLAATNVFVWEDGAWCLVHHQAGPLQPLRGATPPSAGPVH